MRSIFLLAFLFIAFQAFGQKDQITSRWITGEIVIDGAGKDWETPMLYNDDKVSFSITNDGKNVNLIIQTINRSVQQKIMRSGMTVTLSTKGKNKKKVAVFFPMKTIASANTERLSPDQQGNPPNTDQRELMRSQFIERSTEMKVRGLDAIKGVIPISNEYGIYAAINWESEKLFTYELQLPIKDLIASANPEDFPSTPITLKIQVNAMPQPDRPSGSSGRSSGGGGGGGGGGRGGSSPGQAGGSRSAMFTPDTFTTKFILSHSKE